MLKEYGVGAEKIGRPKDPLKYIFSTEDDVFIRVESDKNRSFPRGTVNMPGKTAIELSKILSGKYGREISKDDVKNRIRYLRNRK
jgi:hypothetical protein